MFYNHKQKNEFYIPYLSTLKEKKRVRRISNGMYPALPESLM